MASPARSWVPGADDSGFGADHLPYGVAVGPVGRTLVTAVGAHVLDVGALARRAGGPHAEALGAATLDPFLALGPAAWAEVRAWLQHCVVDEGRRAAVEPHLAPRADARLVLPFTVADYVDFYSSEHHAVNVGRMLRPGADPLPAAWKHLPIGYHGRAGTVVVSGTPIRRPCGQQRPIGGEAPVFGPSRRLDVEAEVGFVVGVASSLGEPVTTGRFPAHVFGLCLVNDWSARDIQGWEYQPLGPFLGKSFATSLAPWVTPLAALEHARVHPPPQDPPPLPYLRSGQPWGLALDLEVVWNGTVVSRPPFAAMYWTAAQQLAHLTANGASVRTGDLFASGTVSGPQRDQRGSFLELSWAGEEPVRLADGSSRTFLADGDTVVIRGSAPGAGGSRIALGEVSGTVLPARQVADG